MSTRARSAASAFRRGMLVLAVGLVLVQLALSWVPQRVAFVPTHDELVVSQLVRDGHCWTAATTTGRHVMPGSALVTLPGGHPELVDARVGFEIWLDGRPGVLHAFCPGLVGGHRGRRH